MANKLFEDYKGRLAISEKYFSDRNDGRKMGNTRKMTTAVCLNNISRN